MNLLIIFFFNNYSLKPMKRTKKETRYMAPSCQSNSEFCPHGELKCFATIIKKQEFFLWRFWTDWWWSNRSLMWSKEWIHNIFMRISGVKSKKHIEKKVVLQFLQVRSQWYFCILSLIDLLLNCERCWNEPELWCDMPVMETYGRYRVAVNTGLLSHCHYDVRYFLH
jgi:hypothetical protein